MTTLRFADMLLDGGVWCKHGEKCAGFHSALGACNDQWLMHYGRGRNEASEAQHAADMAHEITCPVCIGGPASWIQDGEARYCLTCSGTGRVTLGGLVAADRARL